MTHTQLDDATATRFAEVALENIVRPYPYKVDHLMVSEDDLSTPTVAHPVFYGSYDWHSSVHMHWLLVRLLALRPHLSIAAQIREILTARLRADAIAVELEYFARATSRTFERPYGWAWMLRLQAEMSSLAERDAEAAVWADACAPLALHLAQRLHDYIETATFPIRTGTHFNSAFALVMALSYAKIEHHPAFRKAIVRRAHRWFGYDQRYPARYEPGGDEFLSGGLIEAVLMRLISDDAAFADWWEMFAPAQAELGTWLTPVEVADRTDPKMSHLDGLNLSRAWCWRLLEPSLPPKLRGLAVQAWSDHLEASLPQAVDGHYVATHWLATFALLALEDERAGCG